MNGPQRQGAYDITVHNLLLPNVKQWNAQVIREMFDYVVAEEIFQVPLVEEVGGDKWNQKEEQSGCYSVQYGYRLWWKYQGISGFTSVDGDWSSLWNIKASPRVKHLLWRKCKGCLPTRLRLGQHHVQCPSECQLCENFIEDDLHVLFEYDVTTQC